MDNVAEAIVAVRNKLGLHVHPSDLLAKTAVRFLSRITIECGEDIADARNIVDLTALGTGIGARLLSRQKRDMAEQTIRLERT